LSSVLFPSEVARGCTPVPNQNKGIKGILGTQETRDAASETAIRKKENLRTQ
jgi:hypothetical protein